MRSEAQSLKFITKIRKVFIFSSFLIFFASILSSFAFSSDKWPGVDETVVEKYAKEHSREAMKPLIDTDQGDLLLFVFLIAGTVGGFVAGYYWKVLMANKEQNIKGM